MPETKRPTEQTRKIFNKKATLFRDGDKPIYLIEDGRFAYFHDDTWKTFTSVAGVMKSLAKTQLLPAVKVMRLERGLEVIDAVEYKERGLVDASGKRHTYGHWYKYDKKLADAYQAYLSVQEEANVLEEKARHHFDEIKRKIGVSVTRYNFASIAAGSHTEPDEGDE